MERIKVYVVIDKKTGELMHYFKDNEVVFNKKKKDISKELGAEVREAMLEVKIKGLDYFN